MIHDSCGSCRGTYRLAAFQTKLRPFGQAGPALGTGQNGSHGWRRSRGRRRTHRLPTLQTELRTLRKIGGALAAQHSWTLSAPEMTADISTRPRRPMCFQRRATYRGRSARSPRRARTASASTARSMAPHRITLCCSDHGRSSGRPVYRALCSPGPSCASAGEASN